MQSALAGDSRLFGGNGQVHLPYGATPTAVAQQPRLYVSHRPRTHLCCAHWTSYSACRSPSTIYRLTESLKPHTKPCDRAMQTTILRPCAVRPIATSSGRPTHYNPLIPPSNRYTFFVIPTIPNFASSAENPLEPVERAMLAVAIDSRARTRSSG